MAEDRRRVTIHIFVFDRDGNKQEFEHDILHSNSKGQLFSAVNWLKTFHKFLPSKLPAHEAKELKEQGGGFFPKW